MLVKVFSVTMVMLTCHLIYGLPMDGKVRNPRDLNCNKMCPAGKYLDFDRCLCIDCNPGFYTNKNNREADCIRCFQSCTPDLNMVVVKDCTTSSDVQCRCKEGYVCISEDTITHQCKECQPITTPSQSPTQMAITLSQPPPQTNNRDSPYGHSKWILPAVLVTLILIILVLILQFCRKKEEECFKQIVRQCSLGAEVNSETTPPSQPDEQFHAQGILPHISTPTNHKTESFHQPVSSEQAVPPAGKLGPLHIYGPQTVFVSLLNQFGLDGGEKKARELQQETLHTNSDVSYPQSPPVHLSEEERTRENDFIFFPSQEQGKECHISKEEAL